MTSGNHEIEPGTKVTLVRRVPRGPQKRVRAMVAPVPYTLDNRRIDVANFPAHPGR